jgi:DegV family protein with EDD domain
LEAYLIEIITDSTCDIPESLITQYGIKIVSHLIIWNDEQFRDRVDITPVQFYQRLVSDPQRPTTSNAGIPDFQKAYEAAEARGADEVIALTVSSAMSGAYQNALNAAKAVKIPVTVIDSKGPTMTLGWQVLAAARARDAGANVEEIVNIVARIRERMVQFVCMDTIEYLRYGGRIGNAIKWVGGLLQVKPLVSINHQSGLVEPVLLAHAHRAVVETMIVRFFSQLKTGKGLHVALLHGNIQDEAEALAERIRTEFNPLELLVNITGPVLGINTGPRALALCGYAEEE